MTYGGYVFVDGGCASIELGDGDHLSNKKKARDNRKTLWLGDVTTSVV